MCFFKKKKKIEPIIGKFHLNEMVRFRYKGEICPGYIYQVYKGENQEILYDVQIGGECPAIIKGVKEVNILPKKSA